MLQMLTQKQQNLLQYIRKNLEKDGVCPSFEEMKDALGLRSKSGIHRMVTALEERGFIRRLANRARAVEILKNPDGSRANQDDILSVLSREPQSDARSYDENTQNDTVPLVGKIAAGAPIEALDSGSQSLKIPQNIISRTGRYYALEVCGDSMIDAGILNGDIVIIREQITADDGNIVVALVDGYEATLKRLRRKNGMIALEAANVAYETQHYAPEQISVQGRLAGLVRSY